MQTGRTSGAAGGAGGRVAASPRRGRLRLSAAAALLVVACKPLPPAPMMALHDDTAPAPVDATTTTVVIGIADQILGGGGWGLAVRVERQVRDHTAVGGEVTAGSGDRPGDDPGRIALVAVRGYGQSASPDHDFAAVTYGIGGGWMSTGMLTLNAFAAAAVSWPNGYANPYLQAGVAPVWVVRAGERFGDGQLHVYPCVACEGGSPASTRDEPPLVRSDVFWFADVGLVGVLGDTGARVSADLGAASAMGVGDGVLVMSAAGAYRVAPSASP